VFDEIPHSEKVLKRHQNNDDPCIMAWDHYKTQAIDPFPSVDPILPLENATHVVDIFSSSVDPTLPLKSKPDTAHVFLVDTNTTVLGGIPPPVEPPPSNDTILFDWGALTRPRLPSHIPLKIIVQVCGQDIPQMKVRPLVFFPLFIRKLWVILNLCQLRRIS
jgi:hypothetical protein